MAEEDRAGGIVFALMFSHEYNDLFEPEEDEYESMKFSFETDELLLFGKSLPGRYRFWYLWCSSR